MLSTQSAWSSLFPSCASVTSNLSPSARRKVSVPREPFEQKRSTAALVCLGSSSIHRVLRRQEATPGAGYRAEIAVVSRRRSNRTRPASSLWTSKTLLSPDV